MDIEEEKKKVATKKTAYIRKKFELVPTIAFLIVALYIFKFIFSFFLVTYDK